MRSCRGGEKPVQCTSLGSIQGGTRPRLATNADFAGEKRSLCRPGRPETQGKRSHAAWAGRPLGHRVGSQGTDHVTCIRITPFNLIQSRPTSVAFARSIPHRERIMSSDDKVDSKPSLHVLYGECIRNWLFLLEYRFKFLQAYIGIIAACGVGWAWLWSSLRWAAGAAWLIAALASWILLHIEHRNGVMLQAARKAGLALEVKLLGRPVISATAMTAPDPSETGASEPSRVSGPRSPVDRAERIIRQIFFKSEDTGQLRSAIWQAAHRTPAFFNALNPSRVFSVGQGGVLLTVYGLGVFVFFALAVLSTAAHLNLPAPVHTAK